MSILLQAIYRRGLGRSNFGQLDEARQDFLKVVQLDPENLDARQELVNLKNKIKQQRMSDKKVKREGKSRARKNNNILCIYVAYSITELYCNLYNAHTRVVLSEAAPFL